MVFQTKRGADENFHFLLLKPRDPRHFPLASLGDFFIRLPSTFTIKEKSFYGDIIIHIICREAATHCNHNGQFQRRKHRKRNARAFTMSSPNGWRVTMGRQKGDAKIKKILETVSEGMKLRFKSYTLSITRGSKHAQYCTWIHVVPFSTSEVLKLEKKKAW